MQTSRHNPAAPGRAALRKGRVSYSGGIYLVTTTTRDRAAYFGSFNVACAAARCFENPCLLHDSRMLAWVLMPDHVHWLVQVGETDDLSRLVSRLKSASSRLANAVMAGGGSIWCSGFHDRGLRAEEDLVAVARYIVANPLRAGLVRRVADYPFWNAMWL